MKTRKSAIDFSIKKGKFLFEGKLTFFICLGFGQESFVCNISLVNIGFGNNFHR